MPKGFEQFSRLIKSSPEIPYYDNDKARKKGKGGHQMPYRQMDEFIDPASEDWEEKIDEKINTKAEKSPTVILEKQGLRGSLSGVKKELGPEEKRIKHSNEIVYSTKEKKEAA